MVDTDLCERIVAELASCPLDGIADFSARLPDRLKSPGVALEQTVGLLKERYRWAWVISDCRSAYAHMKAIGVLEPAFEAQEKPRLEELLRRDLNATISLANAARAADLGDVILGLGLEEPYSGHLFNIAVLSQKAGMRRAAIRFYRCVNDHGTPQQAGDAAVNLLWVLAGANRFEEVADRMGRLSPPPDLYVNALFEARRYDEAKTVAIAEFERSGKTGPDYEKLARRLVDSGKLADALEILQSAQGESATPSVRYLQALYGHVQRRLNEIESTKADKASGALGVLVCWGQAFVEEWTRITLPCLLHPSNFPALAGAKPVELRIFTDLVGRMTFKRDPKMSELERHVTVTYELIPQPLLAFPPAQGGIGHAYLLFGALWHLGVIEARATGRDVFAVGADAVYATGSWAYIAELVASGREIVFAADFSVNSDQIRERLLSYGDANGHIAIGPRELMDESFRHLHARTSGGFVVPENQYASHNLTYLFFPTMDGLDERMLAPAPLYLQHSALREDAAFDFLTSDAKFIDRLLPDAGDWERIHHITDNDRYAMIELSPPQKNTGEGAPRAITPLTIAAFADGFRHIRMMRRMFEVEYRFRGTRPPPWPAFDAENFLADVRRLLWAE